jgi:hypothetical protein
MPGTCGATANIANREIITIARLSESKGLRLGFGISHVQAIYGPIGRDRGTVECVTSILSKVVLYQSFNVGGVITMEIIITSPAFVEGVCQFNN